MNRRPGMTILGLPLDSARCIRIIRCMFSCSRICSFMWWATPSICFKAAFSTINSSSSFGSVWDISSESSKRYRGTRWIGTISRASNFLVTVGNLSCWLIKDSNSLLVFLRSCGNILVLKQFSLKRVNDFLKYLEWVYSYFIIISISWVQFEVWGNLEEGVSNIVSLDELTVQGDI